MGGGDSAPEQAEVVTRPPEAWAVRVELLRASLAGFYAEVAMLPSIQRVRYLAELGRALDGEHRVLLERAMVAARGDG